jgi:hypothetical protein
MQSTFIGLAVIGVFLFAASLFVAPEDALRQDSRVVGVQIPKSLQVEHAAIHAKLVEATKAPGRVGAAARELAEVLHPHFVREEEIALPPLGLIAPLAAAARPAGMAEVLAMTDTLKKELPRMLEEHKEIRAAVEKLRIAAREEKAVKVEQLADQLALHAQAEEEVFYPASLLVGEVIRARLQTR